MENYIFKNKKRNEQETHRNHRDKQSQQHGCYGAGGFRLFWAHEVNRSLFRGGGCFFRLVQFVLVCRHGVETLLSVGIDLLHEADNQRMGERVGRRVEELLQLAGTLVARFVFVRLQHHIEAVQLFHEFRFGRFVLFVFLWGWFGASFYSIRARGWLDERPKIR